jgi:hypothetical protein
MPVNSKGKPFDQGAANQIYTELLEQHALLKIRHTASFTNEVNWILGDAAELLAGYGVTSLYNLAEKRWTEDEYQTDPSNPDGQPILVQVEKREVYDSTTGKQIPLRELNNAQGDGFTWYAIQFAGQVPIVVAWKELTGAKAFAAQVGSIMSLPPVQALMLAFAFVPMFPGGPTYMASWTQSVGASALGAVGINAAANPLLTKIVGSVAISTIRSGGNLSNALLAAAATEVGSLVGDTVGAAIDSKTVGKVAAAATKAEITGGKIPAAFVAELGIDLATEGIETVSNYLFSNNDYLGTGLQTSPDDYGLGIDTSEFQFEPIDVSSIGVDEINYWDIEVSNDGTLIGMSVDGAILAETPDGKTYDVTSIWGSLPSLDDLNKTLKGLTQLAVTGTTLSNIIEGKPPTGTRPAAGTVQRLPDGSTLTYNANGTVTRRLPDGRVISNTTNLQQQAQMQNLTPLLAIGGVALLLAS